MKLENNGEAVGTKLGPRAALAREYDFIIVGGGSGGSVVARRLAERTDARILLIEAGPSDIGVVDIECAARWTTLLRGDYDWGYDYAPTPLVNHRVIGIPRGRVLGGSSSINAMIWNRGHPVDYDNWEAAGATGWNFSAVLPYFKRAEDWEGGADAYRGAGGPLRVERSHDPHPIALAMLEAAASLGYRVLEDHNGASNEGAALTNLNTVNGKRWSAARGYLRPVLGRPHLTVLTYSPALSLGFEHGRCRSVTHVVDEVATTTRAACEVILCAGAIDTPRLLMVSGIGEAAELKRLGVPVIRDLPGVGQNLQDHPLLMGVNFVCKVPLGPARDNGGGSILNWKSARASRVPDLHAFVAQNPHAGPEIVRDYRVPDACFAISPGLMRSASRGYLRLISAEPGGTMVIQPNFLQEPADFDALVDSIDVCMDLGATSAYASLCERPASPDRRLSRQEREQFVRNACTTFFHTCGTCAMGTGNQAVVDPKLRVRGVDGLRIADASVIPIIPSCNIHAPVVVIGERAADFILDGGSVAARAEQYAPGAGAS